MIHRLKLLIVFLIAFASLAAASPSTLTYRQEVGFEENVGQFPKDVLFRARTGQMHVYVHPTDLRIALPVSRIEQPSFDFVQVAFAGANDDSSVHPMKRLPGTKRYFRAADTSLADISSYARVALRKLYDNIDLEVYAQSEEIEFDLIVHPGGDPSRVRITTGQAPVSVDANGDLLIRGSSGTTLRVKAPTAYQVLDGKRHVIASSYLIQADRSISFRIEPYDRTRSRHRPHPRLCYLRRR
ncbi:MAG TPA: hypothetical protein VEK11_26550 [Thermoanaerobaculia bacterium]|nr:hypothetical protein [Thermoanaerobaculia bacterium]